MTVVAATTRRTFTVLEQFVSGKRPPATSCEDRVVITDHYVAVLDGATDISGATFDGTSGGRFASQTVAAAIERLPANVSARAAIDALTAAMKDALTTASSTGVPTYRPNTTLVMYSADYHQVWRVGDAQTRIADVVHPGIKAIDDVTVQWRRAWNAALLLNGTSAQVIAEDDPGFTAMWPLVEKQDVFANRAGTPWAYGVIDGTHVPDELIDVFDVPGPCDVVLATDGYPHVMGTLEGSERRLANALARDPLGEEELCRAVRPGWSSFDDRAYVRLRVG